MEYDNSLMTLYGYIHYLKDMGVKDIPFSKRNFLLRLRQKVEKCQRCRLYSYRNKLVFGDGNIDTNLMLVGEAPGYEEDIQGIPFVGAAGKLLDRALSKIEIPREEIYIANIVKCHPPKNRNPLADEIASCLPYLKKQIEIISPKIILTLGSIATQTLLEDNRPISVLRGKVFKRGGIVIIPTYHPAYLLRYPLKRKETWEDLKRVKRLLSDIED